MTEKKSEIRGFIFAQAIYSTALLLEAALYSIVAASLGNTEVATALAKLDNLSADTVTIFFVILFVWIFFFFFLAILTFPAFCIFRSFPRTLPSPQQGSIESIIFFGWLIIFFSDLSAASFGHTPQLTVGWLVGWLLGGSLLALVNGAVFGLAYWHFGRLGSVSFHNTRDGWLQRLRLLFFVVFFYSAATLIIGLFSGK